MTIRQLLDTCTERLLKAGQEDAPATIRLAAEELLGITRMSWLMDPDRPASPEEVSTMEAVTERLLHNEPLAYILKKAWFMDLELIVNENVLIPRPETELLVEWVLEDHPRGECHFLDMCAGSGCICLSLLKHRPSFTAAAADISEKALEVVQNNASSLGLSDRLVTYQGDLLHAVPPNETFDLITCNPPYIDETAMLSLPENVKKEPSMALYGGTDGLEFYRRLAKEAGAYLKPEGVLYMEIGYDQGRSVPELFEKEGFVNISVRKDYAGLDRMVKVQKR